MGKLKSVLSHKVLLLFGVSTMVIMLQGCMTPNYNNKNWRRSPPSTGRNRCGCLMKMPGQLMLPQDGLIYQA
ncbi:MAG: hypothetical protein IPH45_02710 [Bacteroidales bacterium]|nr:hypothetical protein [Bacteroidales bacterium]MBK7173240.1 hypothetical protein [Bacteroidales bacterium]